MPFEILILMMAFVYILYSKSLDRFYTGSCLDLEVRMNQHLEKKYSDSFTRNSNDWELFLSIPNLEYSQARIIESHIKKMKSKVYIKNLKKYPELLNKLLVEH